MIPHRPERPPVAPVHPAGRSEEPASLPSTTWVLSDDPMLRDFLTPFAPARRSGREVAARIGAPPSADP